MNKYLITLIVPLLLLFSLDAMAAKQKVIMKIDGMTCNLCTLAVKKSLAGIKGVEDVKVSYEELHKYI